MNLNEQIIRTGWVCPKCGRVLAPTMVECIYCNKEENKIKWNEANASTGCAPSKTYTAGNCTPAKKECKCVADAVDEQSAQLKAEYDAVKRCANKYAEDKQKEVDSEPKLSYTVYKNGEKVEEKELTKKDLKDLDSILDEVLGELYKRR